MLWDTEFRLGVQPQAVLTFLISRPASTAQDFEAESKLQHTLSTQLSQEVAITKIKEVAVSSKKNEQAIAQPKPTPALPCPALPYP